jgi:hypothetical protein
MAVKIGIPVEKLDSLAALLKPKLAEKILDAYWEKNGEKPKLYTIDLARRFVAIAKETKCLNDRDCEQLQGMWRRLNEERPPEGLTEKNLDFLRKVLTPGVWGRVVKLPFAMMEEARRQRHRPIRAAVIAQKAVAIAIEAVAPVRLAKELDSLNPADRKSFRDANAQAIAKYQADCLLIVAGPGTGKSTLFKQRILCWLEEDKTARILALSFVRKLVADLQSDVRNDASMTDDQKKQAEVFTLHKYARSIVERNHGTKEWTFAPHFRIIAQDWKAMVWTDVLSLTEQKDHERFSWKEFEKQLHNDEFDQSAEWKKLKDTYFRLCQFYNAAGFSDIILRAKDALAENPDLNDHQFFIFDEYQDFNASEENLLGR